MAQSQGRKKPVARSTAAGAAKPERVAVQYGPQGSASSKRGDAPQPTGNNRTQLIIGLLAVLVIAAVVVLGVVLNRSNTAIQNDGYGTATKTVATLEADGSISIANGRPPITIDVYEDPLCPFCGAFERQYGQLIAQYLDEGKIAVNYHLLNFLDPKSGSGDYSTRATAAMMCAASELGAQPGVFAALHADLYAEDVQPAEGDEGYTNDELNTRIIAAATGSGVAADDPAVAAATGCVASGEQLPTVTASYTAGAATLTQLTGAVRSPVIVSGGAVLNVDDTAWLPNLVGS